MRELHQPRPFAHLELGDGGVHGDVGCARGHAERDKAKGQHRHRACEGRQHGRNREADDQPGQDARAAPVELTAGEEHRGERADGDEEERQPERPLRRADGVLDRRHKRRPAAPEQPQPDEGSERASPPQTRSQPSGSCGIGQAGSGRQSSQPVGNGHSSRTRSASARTAAASTHPERRGLLELVLVLPAIRAVRHHDQIELVVEGVVADRRPAQRLLEVDVPVLELPVGLGEEVDRVRATRAARGRARRACSRSTRAPTPRPGSGSARPCRRPEASPGCPAASRAPRARGSPRRSGRPAHARPGRDARRARPRLYAPLHPWPIPICPSSSRS